jgi:hypothetical protein
VTTLAATGVYVYGVTRHGAATDRLTGVGDRPGAVRRIEAGDFTATVSDVPAGWHAATRADVEAHDRVLAQLIHRDTVVPMRFGVVMDSDAEVRERLLDGHAAELGRLFAHLDGRVQMSVKAYYPGEALLRGVLAQRPELKRRADALERVPVAASQAQRIALGRDVAAAVEEQRAHDRRALLEPLAALADDVRDEPPVTERQALNAQLLMARGRQAELDDAVRRVSAEHAQRLTLRYVGPLAPYSFADLGL